MSQQLKEKPLVFACAGCSDIAQVANDIAVTLNQNGLARMVCTSGIGGDVPAMIKLAKSGGEIIAIEGCSQECVRRCLEAKQITIDRHIRLTDMGISKEPGDKVSFLDSARLMQKVYAQLGFSLNNTAKESG